MKIQELRNLPVEDLIMRLNQLREGLFKARVRAATKELDNVMIISNTRRDIARILTVLRQKGIKT
ncbi:MAG: 50S ribosomal protein L29 [Candidatus Sumerlaeota bacterium]|nr:50S ribosomal protein L29 [Candidatus Sumerlaeota bacterium]